MDKTKQTHSPMSPKNLAELLPGIKALLSKEAVAYLSSKKQKPTTRNTVHQTWTTLKNYQPMTIAEIMALRNPTPGKQKQTTSTKPKPWNSSVKVNKTKSLTTDGEIKHSTARKGLNFQTKPKAAANSGATTVAAVSRKSIHPSTKASASNDVRISGVYKIPETPVIRKTKQISSLPCPVAKSVSFSLNGDDSFIQKEKEINDFENKCNALIEEPTLEKIAEYSPPTSTPFKDHRNFRDTFDHSEIDNSILWNNNTITSFDKTSENKDTTKEGVIVSLCEMLNKATIVENSNNKNQDLSDLKRQTDDNLKMINNVIQMVYTMNEKKLEHLKHITKLMNETYQTNATIGNNNNVKSIEIAPNNINTMIKEEKFSTENKINKNKNQDLSDLKRQTEDNLKMINNVIQMLNSMKEKESEHLKHITKLMNETYQTNATIGNNNNVKSIEIAPNNINTMIKEEKFSTENSPSVCRPTVIKAKSPAYKIPRKSLCLRKKVFHKSVSNDSENMKTPNKNSEAFKMYMQIKEQITFLNTPSTRIRPEVQDTPARISHTLKKQLDKLYH